MTPREIILELVKTLPYPEKARCVLDSHTDAEIEAATKSKQGAIAFARSLDRHD